MMLLAAIGAENFLGFPLVVVVSLHIPLGIILLLSFTAAGNAIVAVALSSAMITGNALHGNNGTGITVEGSNIVVQNNVVGAIAGAPLLVSDL